MPVVKVLVFGAGGHARVCLDALRDDPRLQVVGCLSADGSGVDHLDAPVLGRDDPGIAASVGATHAFIAIGDNEVRRRLTERCLSAGLTMVIARAGSAVLSPSVQLGAGTLLAPGAVVNAATRLGDGVIVNTNAAVDHDCDIGAFAHVGPAVALAGGVRVGRGALVGIGSRVIPGVSIGEGAVVGAGAVVIADVEPFTTVVGVPARLLGRP